jgi:hypothetical protein
VLSLPVCVPPSGALTDIPADLSDAPHHGPHHAPHHWPTCWTQAFSLLHCSIPRIPQQFLSQTAVCLYLCRQYLAVTPSQPFCHPPRCSEHLSQNKIVGSHYRQFTGNPNCSPVIQKPVTSTLFETLVHRSHPTLYILIHLGRRYTRGQNLPGVHSVIPGARPITPRLVTQSLGTFHQQGAYPYPPKPSIEHP